MDRHRREAQKGEGGAREKAGRGPGGWERGDGDGGGVGREGGRGREREGRKHAVKEARRLVVSISSISPFLVFYTLIFGLFRSHLPEVTRKRHRSSGRAPDHARRAQKLPNASPKKMTRRSGEGAPRRQAGRQTDGYSDGQPEGSIHK